MEGGGVGFDRGGEVVVSARVDWVVMRFGLSSGC